MNKIKTSYIFLLTLCLLGVSPMLLAQYSSEQELKLAANKFFEEENYLAALPLFSQLLSTYPKDVNYNYKYGASYLYATRDKEKAIDFLSFAVSKSTVEPLAYYYMAKAYHHNYNFASAIVYYNKFKAKTNVKENQKYQIERQIEMCENGLQLLKKINKIGVIEKNEIKESEFFRSYDLRGISGKVVVKPDEFQSKADKKNNDRSILFSDPNQKTIVYSSYGDRSNNKDIYKIDKIGEGKFSEPIGLGSVINTEYDEDFAFLHPDGKTLYFSSKGHNSMGGYDIFRSTYNAANDSWSKPINLDFPINTPDDDVLYISDIDNQLAYFASSRSSKQGELTVYRVKVEPLRNNITMIKGEFLAQDNPGMKDVTISILDVNTNEKLGVYKSDSKSGEYILTFPKADRKYKLIVETTTDAPIHSAIIDIPSEKDFVLLKQQLQLVGNGNEEKLVVKNMFDQTDEFDITNPLIVENLLKQSANLNVNTTEEEVLNSLNSAILVDNSSENETINTSNTTYNNLTDAELINTAKVKIAKLTTLTKKSENQSNFYYQLANDKLVASKKAYALDTNNKIAIANDVNQGVLALSLARISESEFIERTSEKQKLAEYKTKIETSTTSGNRKEAENILYKIDEIEQTPYFASSEIENEQKNMAEKVNEKQQEYNKQRDIVVETTNRKLEQENAIAELENKLSEAKKSKDKEVIQAKIDVYKIDLEDINFQLKNKKEKETLAKKEYLAAKNELLLLEQLLEVVDNSETTKPALNSNNKLAIERDITFFETEGIVGLYPTEQQLAKNQTTTSFNEALTTLKDDYTIIDENGNLIDYNEKFEKTIATIEENLSNQNKEEQLVAVNNEWIKSIDEEIQLRNYQIEKEPNIETQAQLQQRIEKLTKIKQQKQLENEEQLTLVNHQIADKNAKEIDNIDNIDNEISNKKYDASTSAFQTIFDDKGNILEYNEAFLAELELFPPDNQSYKAFAKGASIYNNWTRAIEQEIAYKKEALVNANEEEKDSLNDKIEELEMELQDKQEFKNLFLSQAKSLATNEEELSYINTIASSKNNSAPVNTKETPVIVVPQNKDDADSLNEKPILENNSNEVSDIKTWSDQVELLPEVELLKSQISMHRNEYKELIEQAVQENSIENKALKVKLADEAEQSAQEKEIEVASIYEKENAKEFNKNAFTLNRLLNYYQDNSTESDYVMAEMLNEEAKSLAKDAKLIRENTENSDHLSTKIEAKVEANSLEIKAVEKQKQAIQFIDKNNIAASIVIVENESKLLNEIALNKPNSNQSQLNNQQKLSPEIENVIETKENFNELDTIKNNTSSPVINSTKKFESIDSSSLNQRDAKELQPSLIVENKQMILSGVIFAEADRKRKEAEVLNLEAKLLIDSAESNKNFSNKQAYIDKANEMKIAANIKTKEAEKLYKESDQIKIKGNDLFDKYQLTKTNINNENKVNVEEVNNAQITTDEVESLNNSASFNEYKELKIASRQLIKEADVIYIEIEKINELTEEQIELQEIISEMEQASTSEEDKETLKIQLEKLEQIIKENEEKANKMLIKATEKEYVALENNKKAEKVLALNDVSMQRKMKTLEKAQYYDYSPIATQNLELSENIPHQLDTNIEENKQEAATSNNELDRTEKIDSIFKNEADEINTNEREIPSKLVNSIFELTPTNSAAYSEKKPIPKNVTLPEGLVFKVQVGAFRNPIPQDLFKGFNPITAEDAGNGLTRYTAGIFTSFNIANEAKNTVKTIGYPDAFVVAYLNGKRININQARSILNEAGKDKNTTSNNKQLPDTQQTPTINNEVRNTTQNTNELNNGVQSTIERLQNEEVKDGISKDVRNIEGIFYTVQIGVYSTEITKDQLFNLASINSERIQGGLIRYTSGLYYNIDEANVAKERIRKIGISDAFVIAYQNGKKIPVSLASQLIANNKSQTNENNESKTSNNQSQPNEHNQLKQNEKSPVEIVFKVKIGEYEKEVSNEDAAVFLKLSTFGVDNFKDGLYTIYTVGSYTNYQEAQNMKVKVDKIGIKNSSIISFENNELIPIETALEKINNN